MNRALQRIGTCVLALALVLLPVAANGGGGVDFVRGDADADGQATFVDAIFMLNYLVVQGAPPPCLDAADANDGGTINVVDVIYILGFQFMPGFPPSPPPFPDCGPDPTPDGLSCVSYFCP